MIYAVETDAFQSTWPRRGFKAVGVDISKVFLRDARRKAREHGVSDSATFLEGDVRKLKEVIGNTSEPFEVVVNAWTSIGYYSQGDDLSVFTQARELSSEGAILFITETMHSDYLSVKFTPTAYTEIHNTVLLESRKCDPVASQTNTSWAFYKKHGEDLEFIDKVKFEHHITV